MIGYVQLYFKIVGRKEVYYALFDGDFEKPLTRRRLRNTKKIIRVGYSKLDKIFSISFCSKEEYDSFMKDKKEISYGPNGERGESV